MGALAHVRVPWFRYRCQLLLPRLQSIPHPRAGFAPLLQLTGGSLTGSLDFLNNYFNVSTTALTAAAGGGGSYAAMMTALVTAGTVISTSLLGTNNLTMVGSQAVNATTVVASVQVGGGLRGEDARENELRGWAPLRPAGRCPSVRTAADAANAAAACALLPLPLLPLHVGRRAAAQHQRGLAHRL